MQRRGDRAPRTAGPDVNQFADLARRADPVGSRRSTPTVDLRRAIDSPTFWSLDSAPSTNSASPSPATVCCGPVWPCTGIAVRRRSVTVTGMSYAE